MRGQRGNQEKGGIRQEKKYTYIETVSTLVFESSFPLRSFYFNLADEMQSSSIDGATY